MGFRGGGSTPAQAGNGHSFAKCANRSNPPGVRFAMLTNLISEAAGVVFMDIMPKSTKSSMSFLALGVFNSIVIVSIPK